MYSRGFGAPTDVKIPEKYDGTALMDISCETEPEPRSTPVFSDTVKRDIKVSPIDKAKDNCENEATEPNDDEKTAAAGIFSRIPLRLISKIIPGELNFKTFIPKMELEELIILGLAVFLFFSKSGDKECALILLALIFIN